MTPSKSAKKFLTAMGLITAFTFLMPQAEAIIVSLGTLLLFPGFRQELNNNCDHWPTNDTRTASEHFGCFFDTILGDEEGSSHPWLNGLAKDQIGSEFKNKKAEKVTFNSSEVEALNADLDQVNDLVLSIKNQLKDISQKDEGAKKFESAEKLYLTTIQKSSEPVFKDLNATEKSTFKKVLALEFGVTTD